jgi:hypothetical protein
MTKPTVHTAIGQKEEGKTMSITHTEIISISCTTPVAKLFVYPEMYW